MFWGLSLYCGYIRETGQLLLGLPYPISLPHQSKSLCLQFVCNQGNHSVVKTTNLFLQCACSVFIFTSQHLNSFFPAWGKMLWAKMRCSNLKDMHLKFQAKLAPGWALIHVNFAWLYTWNWDQSRKWALFRETCSLFLFTCYAWFITLSTSYLSENLVEKSIVGDYSATHLVACKTAVACAN